MDGYQTLANAVVAQAAKDYREALRRLREHPDSPAAEQTRRECESFFRSAWYGMLTDINPEYIIRRIREEEAE